MTKKTKIEELADQFINTYLKDHPIMVFSLDGELEEFVEEETPELNDKAYSDRILRSYSKTKKKKFINEEMKDELINATDKISKLSKAHHDDYERTYPDTPFLEYMQSNTNPIIYELMHLVVRNKKVRIREMRELEETEQEDPYLPNKWIYHYEWNLEKVLNYIRDYNDFLRKEDELEDLVDFR